MCYESLSKDQNSVILIQNLFQKNSEEISQLETAVDQIEDAWTLISNNRHDKVQLHSVHESDKIVILIFVLSVDIDHCVLFRDDLVETFKWDEVTEIAETTVKYYIKMASFIVVFDVCREEVLNQTFNQKVKEMIELSLFFQTHLHLNDCNLICWNDVVDLNSDFLDHDQDKCHRLMHLNEFKNSRNCSIDIDSLHDILFW